MSGSRKSLVVITVARIDPSRQRKTLFRLGRLFRLLAGPVTNYFG